MKSAKSLYIALFAVSLLVAGNVTVRARTTEQTGDQAKGDSSTAAKSGKKKCRWRGHAKEKQFKVLRRIKRGSCSCQQTPADPSDALGSTAPAAQPTSAQHGPRG